MKSAAVERRGSSCAPVILHGLPAKVCLLCCPANERSFLVLPTVDPLCEGIHLLL